MSHQTFAQRVLSEIELARRQPQDLEIWKIVPASVRARLLTRTDLHPPVWLAVAVADELGADPHYMYHGEASLLSPISDNLLRQTRAFNEAGSSRAAGYGRRISVWNLGSQTEFRTSGGRQGGLDRSGWLTLFDSVTTQRPPRFTCALHPSHEGNHAICPECGDDSAALDIS